MRKRSGAGLTKMERSEAAEKINEQLDAKYADGAFAVIYTNLKIIPVRDRSMIRAAKDGKGVEIQSGRRWLYAFAYQVKFAREAR